MRGTDQGITIQELAGAAFAAHNYPEDMEPSLDAEATYDPVNFNYPHGTHLCAAEVDTETGQVSIRKYACCDDIGNIINPLIVAGQVHGGLVQGIAQALWEEAVYDDSGTLVSGSFTDYLLPTSADTISFDIDHTTSPSLTNTLGTKGVGEAGTIASTPAVVNAVVDAVRHLGINDIQMARVLAVDVGYGQLAWSLRNDDRVVVHDRTNIRDLTLDLVGEPVDVVVGDLSFISLGLVLDALIGVTRPDGDLALMVKPQFEVGKDRVGKGGVVREPELRAEAVIGVARAAERRGWGAVAATTSPLPGPSGNVEFFLWLRQGPATVTAEQVDDLVRGSDPLAAAAGERLAP